MSRRPTTRLNPIERAIWVASWKQAAVSGKIHALIGEDSDKMVNGADRVMYVVLGACAAQGIDPDTPDIRIIRGATNALIDQAEEPVITPERRAGIVSGLEACDRLLPELTQRSLAEAAVELHVLLRQGHIHASDFHHLTNQLQKAIA